MSYEDEHACAALSARYAFCCDRDRERVADLFTEDALLELGDRVMQGREEIRAGMRPRPGIVTLHVCTNTVIDLIDASSARGTTHLLSFGGTGEPSEFPLGLPALRTGGIYFDEFRRVGGRWLFSHRRLERIFAGPK